MFLKRSLKFKLIVLGVILSVAPLMVVAVSTFYQNRHMAEAASDGLSHLAHADLTHMVAGIQTDAMVHVCTGGYVHSRVNNPTSPRPLTKAPVFAANDSCR